MKDWREEPETVVVHVQGNTVRWHGAPRVGQPISMDFGGYGGVKGAYASGDKVVIQTNKGGTRVYGRDGRFIGSYL